MDLIACGAGRLGSRCTDSWFTGLFAPAPHVSLRGAFPVFVSRGHVSFLGVSHFIPCPRVPTTQLEGLWLCLSRGVTTLLQVPEAEIIRAL